MSGCSGVGGAALEAGVSASSLLVPLGDGSSPPGVRCIKVCGFTADVFCTHSTHSSIYGVSLYQLIIVTAAEQQ